MTSSITKSSNTPMNAEQFTTFFEQKCEDDLLQCALCTEPYKDPYSINKCLHVFCRDCIGKAIQLDQYKCPSCRHSYEVSDLIHDFDKYNRIINLWNKCAKKKGIEEKNPYENIHKTDVPWTLKKVVPIQKAVPQSSSSSDAYGIPSSNSVIDWLSFKLDQQNATFEIKEPYAEQFTMSFGKFDVEMKVELPDIPYIRFIDSQFRSLSIGGSATLVNCQVQTIQAIGNVHLRNSEVREVTTTGEVGVFDCTGLKKITASMIYTNQALGEIKINGDVHRLIQSSEPQTLEQARKISPCIPEGVTVEQANIPNDCAKPIIDNGTYIANVVFLEDSIFPEEERVVVA